MQLLGAMKGVTAPPNGNALFSGVSLRSRRRRTKPDEDGSGRGGISIGFRRSSSASGDSSSAMDTPPAPVEIRPRTATRTTPTFNPPVYPKHDVAVHGSMPLDTISKSAPPHVAVRYGDTIRLFARSKYACVEDLGGYVGTFEGNKRFLASKNPQKQDELACIPPIAACGAKQFKPSTFVILSYCGLGVGTPVSYGDVVVLVDADGRVWNNKMGVGPSTKNGCFGPKEANTPGEMYLSFYQLQTGEEGDDGSSESSDEEDNFLFFSNLAKTTKTMAETTFGKPTQVELHLATAALRTMGKVMYYGDRNIIIDVADSNRVRSKFNRVITHFSKQQESAPVQGGFLRCDGRGKTILFEMHGQELPTIKAIDLKDVKKEDLNINDPDMDVKRANENALQTSSARVLVSTRTDVEVGSPLLLQDVRRSMVLVLRFSDGGRVRVPCERFLKHEGRAFYRVVLNGKRPMRVLVRATRALGRKKVDIRGTFRGTYRQIFKLSCGIVLAYLAAASVFTHVFGSMVVLPAIYVGLVAAIVVFLVEVFFPGKVVTARQLKPADEEHSRYFLGNWNFTVVALEASESERLEKIDSEMKSLQKMASMKVPRAFLVAESGDVIKATERYEATLAWRKEVMADSILSMPQTHYDTIKANYTQFLHKHDKLGHPLYIEKVGSINIPQLKKLGVSQDTLFKHYLFAMEFTLKYAAHQICPCDACAASETQKMCIILDARGIGMRDMGGEVFEFIRRCTGVMQRHYPQRSFKIFIVNVPSWFGMAWKGVKPLLNEATRAKTNILTESETAATLLEFIDADNLPVEYGGTCACVGGCENNSSYQLLQQALVKSVQECKPFESDELIQQIERERAGESRSSSEGDVSTETPASSPPLMGPIKRETSAAAVLDQLFRLGSSSDDGFTLDGVDDEGFCRSIPAGYFSEEVLKAGYLLKRSLRHKQFNPIWHRQLFILHPRFLRFAKSLDSEIYQIVSLTHDTVVQKTTKQNNSFEIITPQMAANGHSLLLYALTAYVLNNWVDAIAATIDQLKLKTPPAVSPERSPIVSPRAKQEASPDIDNQPTNTTE
ncbi:Phosphoinositol transporter [Phytophthora nicotianae]|uniref:Phosphoinositol transporter n=1 Tax=Phytophthora nicotianae TaxID=4792 RepID=A0A0W8CGL4_PHYNI|nr:Phosphoinositol transporter [Phytophthora nicotianae]